MPPIHEYICKKCEKEEERLVSFANADQQQCDCEDDAPMQRIDKIYPSNFSLIGNWFKTRGQY